MAERWYEFYNHNAKAVEVSIHLKGGHSITFDGELKVYHPKRTNEALVIHIPYAGKAHELYKRL